MEIRKNIPYGSNNINAYLQAWISSKAEIRQNGKTELSII